MLSSRVAIVAAAIAISSAGAFTAQADTGYDTDTVRAVHTVVPDYPDSPRAVNRSGFVELQYTVDEKGHATDVRVVEAEPGTMFIGVARRALMRSKWEAPMLDGEPRAVAGQSKLYIFNITGD